MEGTNTNEIFQIEGGLSQNIKRNNGQVRVPEVDKKTQLNYISEVLMQAWIK